MKMSKILSLAVLLLAGAAAAMASNPDEKFISVDKLPSTARKFIAAHYATQTVISVQKDIDDDKDYKVLFNDGTSVEFAHNGDMKKLEAGKDASLPASVEALIPAAATAYLKDNYPDSKVTSLEPDGKGLKVGISGRDIKLVFDKKGKYLGADK